MRWKTWAWPLWLALALLAANEMRQLFRSVGFNAVIDAVVDQPAAGPGVRDDPPPLLFVRAHAAAQAGRTQEALALYQASAQDPRIAPAAHYNSANLHLREALQLARDGLLGQQPQSVELAKQRLRDALRADPTLWPARYNLERALRLAPEGEDDEHLPSAQTPAERAATTLRGFTLGLP